MGHQAFVLKYQISSQPELTFNNLSFSRSTNLIKRKLSNFGMLCQSWARIPEIVSVLAKI